MSKFSLDNFQKTGNQWMGKMTYKDIGDLLQDGSTTTFGDIDVKEEAVDELVNLIKERKYVSLPIHLNLYNNELKIVNGFHRMLAISKVAEDMKNETNDVIVSTIDNEKLNKFVMSLQ